MIEGEGDEIPEEEFIKALEFGLSVGLRLFSSVVAQAPWWLRPGFDTSVPSSTWIDTPDGRVLSAPDLPGLGVAMVALVVFVALVALGWVGGAVDSPSA